jgi:hypothetical protein
VTRDRRERHHRNRRPRCIRRRCNDRRRRRCQAQDQCPPTAGANKRKDSTGVWKVTRDRRERHRRDRHPRQPYAERHVEIRYRHHH